MISGVVVAVATHFLTINQIEKKFSEDIRKIIIQNEISRQESIRNFIRQTGTMLDKQRPYQQQILMSSIRLTYYELVLAHRPEFAIASMKAKHPRAERFSIWKEVRKSIEVEIVKEKERFQITYVKNAEIGAEIKGMLDHISSLDEELKIIISEHSKARGDIMKDYNSKDHDKIISHVILNAPENASHDMLLRQIISHEHLNDEIRGESLKENYEEMMRRLNEWNPPIKEN